jgi:hypothetical protein
MSEANPMYDAPDRVHWREPKNGETPGLASRGGKEQQAPKRLIIEEQFCSQVLPNSGQQTAGRKFT